MKYLSHVLISWVRADNCFPFGSRYVIGNAFQTADNYVKGISPTLPWEYLPLNGEVDTKQTGKNESAMWQHMTLHR